MMLVRAGLAGTGDYYVDIPTPARTLVISLNEYA